MANLDTFITRSQPLPQAAATSQEIRDRASTFVANIFPARSPAEAKAVVKHVKHVLHGAKPASHEITAWRCMALKSGCTGLAGPDDFELQTGSDDDGEQWASAKVLKVMQSHAIVDAVVIVSRWYGGTLLGPVRFTHIETCATEVCKAFKHNQEVQDTLATLKFLDSLLEQLREELAGLRKSASTTPSQRSQKQKEPDYESWIEKDLHRAKRLITVREKSIDAVKALLAKEKHPEESMSHAE